jgi:AraC-like DNA-binding protein
VSDDVTSIAASNQEVERGTGMDELFNLSALPIVRLPIASLSQGVRVRGDGVDEDHVRTLADAPGTLPPIVLHRATMTVVDGVHRIAATRARGHNHIDAVLFDGNVMDAYVLAIRLNSLHGLPLSRKDRRAAVARLLEFCPRWSDRRVAAVTGVSPKTVASVRNRSTEETAHSNTRLGLDGHERPVDAREARQRAAELLKKQPTATVRQIAAATGLSPSTVHDVRRRTNIRSETTAPPVSDQIPHHSGRTTRQRTQPVKDTPRQERSNPAASMSTLHNLRGDPSIHSSIAGRTLLQLLSTQTQAFIQEVPLVQAVPAHRTEAIAQLARQCSEAWLNFASEIERSYPE